MARKITRKNAATTSGHYFAPSATGFSAAVAGIMGWINFLDGGLTTGTGLKGHVPFFFSTAASIQVTIKMATSMQRLSMMVKPRLIAGEENCHCGKKTETAPIAHADINRAGMRWRSEGRAIQNWTDELSDRSFQRALCDTSLGTYTGSAPLFMGQSFSL